MVEQSLRKDRKRIALEHRWRIEFLFKELRDSEMGVDTDNFGSVKPEVEKIHP